MKRGWCPTLDQPMQARDGWLVRVRPSLGRLASAQARTLCDAADAFGSGRIDLTSHANLQIRGLHDVATFARAMMANGLKSPVGRLIVSPLAGDDPSAAEGTLELAAQVEAHLAAPHPKFTVVVDGGGALSLSDIVADLRHRPPTAPVVMAGSRPAMTHDVDASRHEANRGGKAPPVGPIAYPGGHAFGFGVPFGALTTAQLRALADISDQHADGTLRLTPWRTLLLGRTLGAPIAPPGLITDPTSPLLRVSACVGRDGCAQSTVDTRATALRFARPGLHVSGCAKGCAHPGPARLTLVGRDGRYDLVRHGRASDPPARRGLAL